MTSTVQTGPPQVGCIGTGMIMHDQLFPALLQLLRFGEISALRLADQGSAAITGLLHAADLQQRFPELRHPAGITCYPPLSTDPNDLRRDYYRGMLDELPQGSIVMIAVPDRLHAGMILECIERGFHVITVKSLCTTYADACSIRDAAVRAGVFVGIDFHKRWDPRNQSARRQWREGRFGRPRAAFATMIEGDSYFAQPGAPFAKHFTCETSDPCTYVGCHYLDLFGWWTGLRPTRVVVMGTKDRFPDGPECYTWTTGVCDFNGEAQLTLINGLQMAGHARTRNHQGIEIWGAAPNGTGTHFEHLDHLRGRDHAYARDERFAGMRETDAGSDYVEYVPRRDGTPGELMTGYGWEGIAEMVREAARIQRLGDIGVRREALQQIDALDLMPTPATTAWLSLVYEAMRTSITNGGRLVDIDCVGGTQGLS